MSAAAATGPACNWLVPKGSRLSESCRRCFATATLLYAAYYLVWRWTETLNPAALWFAVPLALAETFALTAAAFFVFNVWRLRRRPPLSAPPGLEVDVFVTTYNEPVDLIRKTAVSARDIRYPHRTYILDDGDRAAVRELACELGIEYIARRSNEGAKAGNLNHALRQTRGDFILQLDADHVPLPSMLDRLLGYFRDPRMAFVQSPQCFYNHDGFTGYADRPAGRYYAEQDIFFNVIQAGKDRHNAAFFCGSCAVIRRSALTTIGGFSAYSITEDFETSLRLHAKGWRSAYHGEALAYGLATRTAESFHTQRVRWGRGTMQVWRRFNPLTLRGLSLPQRLCYFYSVLVYLDGLPRLVFYLAPVIYLLGGVLPIRSSGLEFLAHFAPLLAASVLLNRVMARGHGAPFWLLERNNLAKVWTHTIALTGYFTRKPLRFGVTGKTVGGVALRHLLPHTILVLVTVIALVVGSAGFIIEPTRYGHAGGAAVPFLVNVAWAVWNGVIACLVLHTAFRSRERRAEYRFPENLPVVVTEPIRNVRKQFELGHLIDMSAAGVSARVGNSVDPGLPVQLIIALPDGPLSLTSTVVRSKPDWVDGRHSQILALRFAEGQDAERDRLTRHCMQRIAPRVQQETQQARPFFELPRLRQPHRQTVQPLFLDGAVNIDMPITELEPLLAGPEWPQADHPMRRLPAVTARTLATIGLALVLLGASSRPANSQVPSGYVAAAEAVDNGQRVYLAGAWWTPRGSGWLPTASLFGYRIELARGVEPDAIWAVNPAVGVRNQSRRGGVQGTIGYTWQSVSGDVAADARRVGSGVTTALQADYWGSGALAGQLIVSHSWGGDGYTWSRMRATHRIARSAAGALALGAELGWQGNQDFEATDAGGVIEWRGRPIALVVTVGYRSVHEGTADSAPYVGVAVVIMP